jgi:hypothetical protein
VANQEVALLVKCLEQFQWNWAELCRLIALAFA